MAKEKVELNGKTVLVTGSPGFIGANLVLRLLREMSSGLVISLDNMNDYYDPALKEYRLRLINESAETAARGTCLCRVLSQIKLWWISFSLNIDLR